MPAKPWSKAQAKNNRKFQAKLDKITNYLIEGDWHADFANITGTNGDTITNFAATKEILSATTLSFSRLENGALKAVGASPDDTTSFIAGIQPYEKTFYLINIDGADGDVGFGEISMKSGVINLTFFDQSPSGEESVISVTQFTNLAEM